MLLKKLFVRFYKSFNYDYLKKSSLDQSQDKPWEWVNEKWYPYVEIPIDGKVTTVVGANESGKSHLLSAIKKGITGQDIEHEDFCRYSQFFTVTKGEFKFPDFGFEWTNLSETEQKTLRELASIPPEVNYDQFLMFRRNREEITIYIYDVETFRPYSIDGDNKNTLSNFLPKILPIKSKIALPDSVPIQQIINIASENIQKQKVTSNLEQWQLEKVYQMLDVIATDNQIYLDKGVDLGIRHNKDGEKVPMFPASEFYKIPLECEDGIQRYSTLQKLLKEHGMTDKEKEKRKEEFKLAYDLICKVAEIDPEFLNELVKNAFRIGKEGYLSAIIDRINKNLSERLNFPSWWVQDKEFKLVVSANHYHLKFAIKDKTGTTYSFSERSQGLQYFLSYYIQYKSHQPSQNQQEILLMDEPDAYLSSQAQQDLMKIFKAFADGKDEKPPVQVIFVTHSPFLVDKNHPERIRVLEKGTEEEGTRLVKDIARNHYEPLRSSVGSLIGETAFIGNCNLIVSSLSEQILIAGLATYLNQLGVSELDTLDLNHITIVPAGNVLQIPYLVHLLQRDTDKPAIIALLNSDKGSDDVRSILEKNQTTQLLLKNDFVFQVSELNIDSKVTELEDLISLSIAVKASYNYAEIFVIDQEVLKKITVEVIKPKLSSEKTLFNNLEEYLKEQNIFFDRFGFVRNVIDLLQNQNLEQSAIEEIKSNFKHIFNKINEKKRKFELDFGQEKNSEKFSRFIKAFKMDNPKDAKRVNAEELFKKIENILDTSKEHSKTRATIDELRQKYKIQSDPLSKIDNYQDFLEKLENVIYTALSSSQDPDHKNQFSEQINCIKNSSTSKSNSTRKQSATSNKNGFG